MAKRDAERSRQNILAAAEQEFSEKGFFGARVDEIAAKAQINKRMIYAYFTDKEGLYMQVLFQVYGRMEEVERSLIARQYTGKELVTALIGAYFDFLRDNPTFVNILMWENLNQAQYLRELENSRIERDTIRYFVSALEQGRANGIFRPDIDPMQTVLSMITICFANFSNQHTLSKLFSQDLTSEDNIKQRKQHTVNIMVAYLCNYPKEEINNGNNHLE